jgi:hypothetical protein
MAPFSFSGDVDLGALVPHLYWSIRGFFFSILGAKAAHFFRFVARTMFGIGA